MLLNCGVREDFWSPWSGKEFKPGNPKGIQSWIFIGKTDAEAEALILWPPDGEELSHLKRPWSWEILKAGEEGDDRGWDGWMAPLTWWTWVWARSSCWWWTGKPGMLQCMGSQSKTWLSNWIEQRYVDFAPETLELLSGLRKNWLRLRSFNTYNI